jgi:hypothetical protein
LLPIAPPMVAREWVDGSGPKRSPCGAAVLVIASSTVPGSTTAVRSSWSTDSTRFRCREVSSTTPVEMALPAMDVPAPRATTGTPSSRHAASAAMISSVARGKATTAGTTR